MLPGDYRVRLRFGDREQVRELTIAGDPEVDISAADRAAWHDTLVSLHDMIGVSHAIVTTARQLGDQLAQVRETLSSHPDEAQAVGTRLDGIENIRRGQNNRYRGNLFAGGGRVG